MADWSGPRFVSVPSRPGLANRLLDRDSFVRRMDWLLVLAVGALCVIGSALVWAATKPQELAAGGDPHAYLTKNVLNVSIGVVLAVVAAAVDYRTLRAYTPVLYLLSVVGLLVVFVPHVGATINGAHSWIPLAGGFEIQPSEFMKVAIVLGMAMLLSERREGFSEPTTRDVVLCFALVGVPALLVLLQPDVGTIMVVGVMVFGMIALSGVGARWVVGMIVVAVVGALVIDHLHLLQQYQVDRLTSFFHANSTAAANYNPQQARIAIGSGGIFGKGLFHGTQTNGQFVPEQQTDFIFSVAGEELGLVGAGLVVLLIGVVLWRALRIARLAEDTFGMLVAIGVVCWFAFQAFENIGMNLGIMPITGLPLPFVSYGGSSMFADMLGIGLLQNVYLRSLR
jgi:rod shape determining protein RodA